MPLRFRILAAARDVRAAWKAGSSSDMAEGPLEERAFEIAADLDELRVGRQPNVEIELPFPAVSSLHARLFRGELPADWNVEDLGSMNGSWIDGQRLSVRRPVPLRPGQRLRIATVDMVFEGWSATSAGHESTATIARRLISDLFGVVDGDVPRLSVEFGPARQPELRLTARDRRYLAGRADSCDLVLASEHVSREHAAFIRRWDGVVLVDLGSKNGLMVNGQPMTGERRLADGDRINVGTVTLTLTDPEDRYLRRLESLAPQPSSPSAVPPSPSPSPSPASPAPASASDGPRSMAAPATAPTPPGDGVVAAPSESARPSRPPPSWMLTTIIAVIAVLAIAGLIALWLTTR